jgi:hypothetical protein
LDLTEHPYAWLMQDQTSVDVAEVLCSLHVGQRTGLAVVSGVVAEAADALGVATSERTRLRAVAEQVLDVIVADSFSGDGAIDIDVTIERRPGGMAVVLSDRGAPSSLALGTYPPEIANLIQLGFADDLTVQTMGREGNRTEITKRLHYSIITDDEEFTESATGATELELDSEGKPIFEVRPMTEADVFEVARLFYRTYGYSASYAAAIYEPELLAEYVKAGRHVATVAVTPSGRIIAHLASKVERPGAKVSSLGLLAVEPAYRSFGITKQLGFVHIVRLVEMGFVGQYSEAVTVHDRSQKLALKTGGHEVGLILAWQSGNLEMAGFDVDPNLRRAVMLIFGSFGSIPERTVHVPLAYREVAERIYAECAMARTLSQHSARSPEPSSEATRFRVQLKQEGNTAILAVEHFGDDFDTSLQSQLNQFRLHRYDLILLMLPLSDPRASFYGDGLQSMGLSFAGIYPEYDDGDVLVLQSLNNVEVEPDAIVTASDFGAEMKDFVLSDRRAAAESTARQQRSRTHMARVLEALD